MRHAHLLIALLLAGCVRPVHDRLGPSPVKCDFEGIWVGYDNTTEYFYGLALRNDPGGELVCIYEGHAISKISIKRWELSGGRILVDFHNGGSNMPAMISADPLGASGLRIRLQGAGWEQSASLLRAESLDREMDLLKSILDSAPSNP